MAKHSYEEPGQRVEYVIERYHRNFLTTLLVSLVIAVCIGIIIIFSFDFSKTGIDFGIWFLQGILVMTVLFFSLGTLYKKIFTYGWEGVNYPKRK